MRTYRKCRLCGGPAGLAAPSRPPPIAGAIAARSTAYCAEKNPDAGFRRLGQGGGGMDEAEQARYRTILEDMAADLRRRLAASDASTAPVAPDRAIGRLTRQEAMQAQQMSLAVRRRWQQQLQRIAQALELVRQGRYGRCGTCGEEIARERLAVMPDTFLCVPCVDRRRPG
jgi:DnaK suppressor protein